MYFALRASQRLFKSVPADLAPTKALGNDDSFFIFMRFLEIDLIYNAEALY